MHKSEASTHVFWVWYVDSLSFELFNEKLSPNSNPFNFCAENMCLFRSQCWVFELQMLSTAKPKRERSFMSLVSQRSCCVTIMELKCSTMQATVPPSTSGPLATLTYKLAFGLSPPQYDRKISELFGRVIIKLMIIIYIIGTCMHICTNWN